MKFTEFVSWMKMLSVLSLICCFTLTVTAENYYPSEIGNTWVLLSTDGSEQITYALEAPENNNIAGLVELKITSEVIGADSTSTDTYFVTVNDGDILLHRSVTDQGVLGIAEVTYDPPVIFFPAELLLGQTWQIISETELKIAGALTSTSTITVVAIEDVETPAGVFKDCAKLEIKQRDVTTFGVLRKTSYQWLGPDIGPVKYLNNQDIAYELQSYNLIEPIAEDAPPTEITEPTKLTVDDESVGISANYTFETIDVPGVDFLAVTASNDFGDYAGNTRSTDGEKTVGFTLIDGVFTTYDFPGSQNTYFYALGNNGVAAGHYKDSKGLYHGVILENGELRQYDFPGAAETHIYGISDETGALSGNIVDAAGVTHAFSGELTITFPGAINTYGDFVNAAGAVVGSYVDADGMPHGFIRNPDGSFTTIDLPTMPNLEFLFVNTITDAGVIGFRAKAANDILRSYILLPSGTLYEVRLPGSVVTVVRNVNQDGSIIGYYDLADGRRLGFIGRPKTVPNGADFGNIFSMHLSKGLNMLSVPLKPTVHMTARSLAVKTGATTVITFDTANQAFLAWTPNAPDDGFPIEGAKGYIVNLPAVRDVVFTGTRWANQMPVPTAPLATIPYQTWAFVVSGYLEGIQQFDGYIVKVRNRRTNGVMETRVRGNYFAAATADLTYRSVIEVGDTLELIVTDTQGNIVSERFNFVVNAAHLENAVMTVLLDSVGTPKRSQLLQNYPNPFNPETWIPYQLSEDGLVLISIYEATGQLVRTLPLGFQSAGFYNGQARAAYWDGRNALGERVASGIYFYQLTTPSFQQTRRLVIVK